MSGARLFDVGPEPEQGPHVGQDALRTIRRRALLDAGVHPTTKLRLREPAGETCATCDHHEAHTIRSGRTFHKCGAVIGGPTNGPATDVRVSWPACQRWEPLDLLDGPPGGPSGQ